MEATFRAPPLEATDRVCLAGCGAERLAMISSQVTSMLPVVRSCTSFRYDGAPPKLSTRMTFGARHRAVSMPPIRQVSIGQPLTSRCLKETSLAHALTSASKIGTRVRRMSLALCDQRATCNRDNCSRCETSVPIAVARAPQCTARSAVRVASCALKAAFSQVHDEIVLQHPRRSSSSP